MPCDAKRWRHTDKRSQSQKEGGETTSKLAREVESDCQISRDLGSGAGGASQRDLAVLWGHEDLRHWGDAAGGLLEPIR